MNPIRVLAAMLLVWAIGLVGPAGAQTVRYVATTGTDIGTCSAPGAPCRTLQYTVSQVVSNDEIRVAAGTYGDLRRNGTNWAIVDIDRSASIRGGYGPDDWTVSDPVLLPTVLDAGFQYTILTTSGTFQPGETLTGGVGGASATLAAIDGVRFKLAGITGSFGAGDAVTGAASGAHGLVSKAYSVTVTAGTVQSGETLTGATSGATGRLADITGNRLAIAVTSGTFQAGETLTGATSSATGTLDDVRVVSAGRVVRIAGTYMINLEALTLTNGLANTCGSQTERRAASPSTHSR